MFIYTLYHSNILLFHRSNKDTEQKRPKWQPPKKDENIQIHLPTTHVQTSKWQTKEPAPESPTKKTGSIPVAPPAPACPSPKKYAAPPPPTGSPIKSKASIVLMEPQSSDVKPKHQVKKLADKEPVKASTSAKRNNTTAGETFMSSVSKVEQPVKQMATTVGSQPSGNREPESDDPAAKPVSSRMASWQQRINSAIPPKEEEPTAYSVNARMSAWETMTSSNQVSNIKKVDPGSSPSKSPCRQGPIQSSIKGKTVTPSKVVKESIMEKASKIQHNIATPVSNQTPGKLQPAPSPSNAKIGSATKMIHQKLFDQAAHSKTADIADQMRKERMAELSTLQNRWHNGVLKEDKPQVCGCWWHVVSNNLKPV